MTETAPDTGDQTPADTPPADAPPPSDTDTAAELEKWKAQARKHEERAKANAKAASELEQLRRQSMTDLEKAVDEAKAAGRAEALREIGGERVADAVRVAAAGRPVDVDALLEGLDRARFLTEEGQPDTAAITAWVDKVAPKGEERPPGFPDLGQGARTSALPLNGDPLTQALARMVGPPRG